MQSNVFTFTNPSSASTSLVYFRFNAGTLQPSATEEKQQQEQPAKKRKRTGVKKNRFPDDTPSSGHAADASADTTAAAVEMETSEPAAEAESAPSKSGKRRKLPVDEFVLPVQSASVADGASEAPAASKRKGKKDAALVQADAVTDTSPMDTAAAPPGKTSSRKSKASHADAAAASTQDADMPDANDTSDAKSHGGKRKHKAPPAAAADSASAEADASVSSKKKKKRASADD